MKANVPDEHYLKVMFLRNWKNLKQGQTDASHPLQLNHLLFIEASTENVSVESSKSDS